MIIKKGIIILIVLIGYTSCNGQANMKKYEWKPTACAPKYFPAEIVDGDFYMEDESSIYIPTGHTLMHGWGKTGAAHIVGDAFKAIPNKLSIRWVSYLEEKFYGGTFELPTELIRSHFERGFYNRDNEQETYTSIVAGVAPGGVLVIWMLAASSTVEIARFKASEIDVDKEDFIPDAVLSVQDYIKKTKKNIIDQNIQGAIDVHNIPFGRWDLYRIKNNWFPVLKFKQDPKTKLLSIGVRYFNGEGFYTYGANPELFKLEKRAMPERIQMEWQNGKGTIYGAKLLLDANEMQDLFDTVFVKAKVKQIEFVMEIDKYNSNIKVYLKTEDQIYSINKAEIKVYETTAW